MTYTITSQCISCDRCLSACPTDAIRLDGERYQINPDLCNNCAGSYGVPQCWAMCPTTSGCIPDTAEAFRLAYTLSDSAEYWERWFEVYNRLVFRLHQTKQDGYWENWFDRYSQKLAILLRSPQKVTLHPPIVTPLTV